MEIIFQPLICKEYVSFRGSNASNRLLWWMSPDIHDYNIVLLRKKGMILSLSHKPPLGFICNKAFKKEDILGQTLM